MPAKTIDDVIDRLDDIIATARREKSRVGYFATLYRQVTVNVKRGIAAGHFENGPRMEHLDVIFANRYLAAYDAWRAKKPMSRCWATAFDAAGAWPPLILQHLLLGINAHINLDLGIAAAQTAPGAELAGLRNDFQAINTVLGDMLDDVQDRISTVSPWMGIVDFIGQRTDEEICTFCLGASRDIAWQTAIRFASLKNGQTESETLRADAIVTGLAGSIRNPGLWASTALLAVRARESSDVPRVLDALTW